MTWDDPSGPAEAGGGNREPVELVGPNLRLTGAIAMGRFGRLSDLVNASSGYIRVHDARLLKRNGDPTTLVFPEMMVDQDEISFIAQRDAPPPEPGSAIGFLEPNFGAAAEARKPREFVMFTPAHIVTGKVHVFGATDLAGFVDASDPRFVAVTEVTSRSLTDARIVSRFDFVLINRTQMVAASEVGRPGDVAPEDVPEL
jgi:hypothetical protein